MIQQSFFFSDLPPQPLLLRQRNPEYPSALAIRLMIVLSTHRAAATGGSDINQHLLSRLLPLKHRTLYIRYVLIALLCKYHAAKKTNSATTSTITLRNLSI